VPPGRVTQVCPFCNLKLPCANVLIHLPTLPVSPKSATILLSQFKDNSQYSMLLHLLETYTPQEVILPHTMEGSALYVQLQNSDFGFVTPVKVLSLGVHPSLTHPAVTAVLEATVFAFTDRPLPFCADIRERENCTSATISMTTRASSKLPRSRQPKRAASSRAAR